MHEGTPSDMNSSGRYSHHIVLIGAFGAYMKMIGKKMVGSSLEDVLLESGLISGGSKAGVMDQSVLGVIEEYVEFRESITNGHSGKTLRKSIQSVQSRWATTHSNK